MEDKRPKSQDTVEKKKKNKFYAIKDYTAIRQYLH